MDIKMLVYRCECRGDGCDRNIAYDEWEILRNYIETRKLSRATHAICVKEHLPENGKIIKELNGYILFKEIK